jgi:hypothetical protein
MYRVCYFEINLNTVSGLFRLWNWLLPAYICWLSQVDARLHASCFSLLLLYYCRRVISIPSCWLSQVDVHMLLVLSLLLLYQFCVNCSTVKSYMRRFIWSAEILLFKRHTIADHMCLLTASRRVFHGNFARLCISVYTPSVPE